MKVGKPYENHSQPCSYNLDHFHIYIRIDYLMSTAHACPYSSTRGAGRSNACFHPNGRVARSDQCAPWRQFISNYPRIFDFQGTACRRCDWRHI